MINMTSRHCLAAIILSSFVVMRALAADWEPAKEKPAKPGTSGSLTIWYAYPGNEIKPQSEIATVIIGNHLSLEFSGSGRKTWRKSGPSAKVALRTWEFVDIPPGTYEVSATYAAEKKYSEKPIVRTLEFNAGTVYYANPRTSSGFAFNYITFKKAKWGYDLTDNIVDEAREKVIAARNIDIKDKAELQIGPEKMQAGERGSLLASVPVPQGLGADGMGACVVDAMKARKWKIVTTTESTAIGQFSSRGWTYYICVIHNDAKADIYGPQAAQKWSNAYKAALIKQLKIRAGGSAKK